MRQARGFEHKDPEQSRTWRMMQLLGNREVGELRSPSSSTSLTAGLV